MFLRLAVMTGISFVAMYLLMYTMIDKWADFYPSVSMRTWPGV